MHAADHIPSGFGPRRNVLVLVKYRYTSFWYHYCLQYNPLSYCGEHLPRKAQTQARNSYSRLLTWGGLWVGEVLCFLLACGRESPFWFYSKASLQPLVCFKMINSATWSMGLQLSRKEKVQGILPRTGSSSTWMLAGSVCKSFITK